VDLFAGNLIMIVCFVIGTGLVILEAFIPGFGVAGLVGVVLEIIAIVSAWANHGTLFGLGATVVVLVTVGLAIWLSYRSALRGRLSKSPLILKDKEASPVPEEKTLSSWVGRKGKVVTALKPGGTVEIDGNRLSAVSEGPFLEKGAAVRVIGVQGAQLVVRGPQAGE